MHVGRICATPLAYPYLRQFVWRRGISIVKAISSLANVMTASPKELVQMRGKASAVTYSR